MSELKIALVVTNFFWGGSSDGALTRTTNKLYQCWLCLPARNLLEGLQKKLGREGVLSFCMK